MTKISSIESLRALAVKLDARFDEGRDRGFFTFNNDYGQGSIRALKIFFGLEVICFDVYLESELVFDYHNIADSYLHCIFIQEGFLKHRFNETSGENDASRFQNVIVSSSANDFSTFVIPPNVKAQFVVITIERVVNYPFPKNGRLQGVLNDVLEKLSYEAAYSFFGNFSSEASVFVNNILNTIPNSLSNILLLEANVLNTLSCQFLDHENRANTDGKLGDLSKNEILQIVKLSEYIAQNLGKSLKVSDLERQSGLNQKRIQKGFKNFFGMSVNKYIVNLRILRAKELIETTEHSISEIVYKIGLNSRSYFSKIFAEKYGLLPNEYRKNFRIYNPIFELTYFSKAKIDLSSSDFNSILSSSRNNNSQHNITGCLLYHKDYFFQILEGPKEAVIKTFEKITKDHRHVEIKKLYDGIKSGRTFDEWDMAFLEKPSLFSTQNLADFKFMNIESILKVDKDFGNLPTNMLQVKLMWERSRNALLSINNSRKNTYDTRIIEI